MASTQTRLFTALPWWTVAVLWLAYLANYVDRQVVFSIFPVLRSELQFTEAQLGLVGTVFVWVYSLCMPITGRLADIYPRQRLIVLSLFLWSLATLGTALASSVPALLAWRAVMGITESLYVPAALGLIASLHPGATRSRALGIHAIAQFAGIVTGGWYGGWTAEHIGWRTGFVLLGVFGIAYAFVLARFFRRLPARPAGAVKIRPEPLAVFRSRCYLAQGTAFFCFNAMLWMFYAWLPNFIYQRYGLSMAESGLTATIYLQTSCAAGVLLGGYFGDRFSRRVRPGRFYICALGLLLCAPLAWLTLALDSLLALKIASAGFGFTAGLFIANWIAAVYDVIAERNYGFAAGCLNMVGGLAGGAAIFGAGILGLHDLMRWGALATAAAAILLAFTAWSRRHKEFLRGVESR